MALNPNQMKQLLAFTQTKWQSPHCQLCNYNAWAIEGPVQLDIEHPTGSFEAVVLASKRSMPCALFTCRNCGNTVVVNLVIAGLALPESGLKR